LLVCATGEDGIKAGGVVRSGVEGIMGGDEEEEEEG
jgi:hypothetical protein